MFSKLSSLARSGLIALTAVAVLPAAAPAAPFGPTVRPAVADNSAMKPIQVQGEGRDRSGSSQAYWPRRGGGNWGGGNWRRGGNWGGGNWRRGGNWGGGNWRRGGNWDGRHSWNGRRNWRRHRGWDDDYWGWGSGVAIGLGIPLAYGLYGGYGGYYDEPTYRPRGAYGGSSHAEWCYNRYRSYRAWDNTWQPYHGRRRQCYSPYS